MSTRSAWLSNWPRAVAPCKLEPQKDGVRVIVPAKFSSGPAAVFDIEERSGGSSIKLHERMSNVPVRPKDVQKAANTCISG